MTGSEVAVSGSAVPALRKQDSSRQLDAQDFAFPRLYLGQAITRAVENELVESGAFFVATGQDDTEPLVVAERGSEAGVVIYVLDVVKGWSKKKPEGQDGLDRWRWDDPDRPPDAWRTYTYFLAIPDVDEDLPIRYLMTRTAAPSAKKVNTVLGRLSETAPYWTQAFRLTAELRRDKYTYYVPVITTIDPVEAHVPTVEKLARIMGENSHKVDAEVSGTEEGPTF